MISAKGGKPCGHSVSCDQIRSERAGEDVRCAHGRSAQGMARLRGMVRESQYASGSGSMKWQGRCED